MFTISEFPTHPSRGSKAARANVVAALYFRLLGGPDFKTNPFAAILAR